MLSAAITTSRHNLSIFNLDEEDANGFYIANYVDDDFRIVITREARFHTVPTIAGEREVLGDFYNIYLPKYDEGDPDVGMDSYYYTDIEEDYDMTSQDAAKIAVKTISWFNEYEIQLAVNNAAEYRWECEREELEQV